MPSWARLEHVASGGSLGSARSWRHDYHGARGSSLPGPPWRSLGRHRHSPSGSCARSRVRPCGATQIGSRRMMHRSTVVMLAGLFACVPRDLVIAETIPDGGGGGAPNGTASSGGCMDNDDCLANAFCQRDTCDAPRGSCVERPLDCSDSSASPVCGCDSVNYWNDSAFSKRALPPTSMTRNAISPWVATRTRLSRGGSLVRPDLSDLPGKGQDRRSLLDAAGPLPQRFRASVRDLQRAHRLRQPLHRNSRGRRIPAVGRNPTQRARPHWGPRSLASAGIPRAVTQHAKP